MYKFTSWYLLAISPDTKYISPIELSNGSASRVHSFLDCHFYDDTQYYGPPMKCRPGPIWPSQTWLDKQM